MTWKELIQELYPTSRVSSSDMGYYLGEYANEYGVNTKERQAAFLANLLHETANLDSLVEYSSGQQYEGRADLGNTQPGDGTKFKGRGGFMVTGRANYKDVSQHLFGDDRLLKSPELLQVPKYAVQSSLYYWKSRGLSALADKEQYKEIVKRINGGYNGLEDRTNKLNKILDILDSEPIGVSTLSSIIVILVIVGALYAMAHYING